MADKVAASSGGVAIETGIFDGAVVAVEEGVEAVGAAREPVPAIAAIEAQVLGRLKLEPDFRCLDIFKLNVIILLPRPPGSKKTFKAVVHLVLGITIAGSVTVKGAQARLPAMLEGIPRLKGIAMRFMALSGVSAELVDQVSV